MLVWRDPGKPPRATPGPRMRYLPTRARACIRQPDGSARPAAAARGHADDHANEPRNPPARRPRESAPGRARLEERGDVLPGDVGLVDVVGRAEDQPGAAERRDPRPAPRGGSRRERRRRTSSAGRRSPTGPAAARSGGGSGRASMCSGWSGLMAIDPDLDEVVEDRLEVAVAVVDDRESGLTARAASMIPASRGLKNSRHVAGLIIIVPGMPTSSSRARTSTPASASVVALRRASSASRSSRKWAISLRSTRSTRKFSRPRSRQAASNSSPPRCGVLPPAASPRRWRSSTCEASPSTSRGPRDVGEREALEVGEGRRPLQRVRLLRLRVVAPGGVAGHL